MASTSTEARRVLLGTVLIAAALAACRGGPPRLAPLPPVLTGLEGDGSLSLTGPGGTARSRFSLVVVLPTRARVDVFDPLGRLVYFLLITGDDAWLAVPSKKAFVRGDPAEVLGRFLGFGLTPNEMAGLLTGRWPETNPEAAAWTFRRDDRGRIAGGERGGLRFEVREFFADSGAPRLLAYEQDDERGRVKIYRLAFNRPRPGATEAATLLKGCRELTWPEMEALLGDAD